MKILYIEMIDNWSKTVVEQMGGRGVICSRVVRLPLTQEQEALIRPREVGSSNGKPMYEEMRIITIQDEG